jgi:hypothetical protein
VIERLVKGEEVGGGSGMSSGVGEVFWKVASYDVYLLGLGWVGRPYGLEDSGWNG